MRVVVLSSTRWSSAWLSKQHLTAALARLGHEVLYVDPPVSPMSLLRQRDRFGDLLSFGDERPLPGVTVWRPRVLPAQDSAVVQPVNARHLVGGILRRMPAPDLCVAFALEARSALSLLPGRRAYYCTDSLADHPANEPAAVRAREALMLSVAEVVVGCSRPLVTQLAAGGARPRYIPHGCDGAAFEGPFAVPDALASLPRPLVGYAGGMNFRVDHDLLAAARLGAGDGTLVLIGGAWASARGGLDPRAAEVIAAPGVVHIGHQDGAGLARHIAALDVGVVPYATTAFNRKSFPLKIPQYRAAGVPVVSTPNGATDELEDVVVAESAATFEEAVRAAAGGGRHPPDRVRTWDDVARDLLDACA